MIEAYLETVMDSGPARFPLQPGGVYHIGRDDRNEIALSDHQVSRNHALIQCSLSGECSLVDLGSRNGTFLNQRRVVAPVTLQPGDSVRTGSQVFVFRGPGTVAEAITASRETVVEIAQCQITVLVADIRDFTGLSSRLEETRLSQVIGGFNRRSGDALASHSAWTQKYIGDAVMAIWIHREDTPQAAELAAVAGALGRIFDIAAGLQSEFSLDEPVRIGAGINTGLACIGNMGSGANADYTALSDAVNLAFRLESATKETGCDVAVGQKTYRALQRHGCGEDLFVGRSLLLKGYREPKDVFCTSRAALSEIAARLRGKCDTDPGATGAWQSVAPRNGS